LNGALVGTTFSKSNTPDAYGNMQSSTTQTSDGFVTTASTVFYNDTANWRFGLPVRTSVTSTTPAAFSSTGAAVSATRTSVFVYDSLGRVLQEVVEPATNTASSSSYAPTYTLGANTLVTTYGYDSYYGYRNSVTLSGLSVTSRTTTTAMDFINNTVTTTNAVGHSEVQTLDPRWGVPTSLKGPNNLYTYWDYDGFGRKIKERRADGTYTTIEIGYCGASGCSTGAGLLPATSYATTFSWDKVNAVMSISQSYSDLLGREIQSLAIGFDGNWLYKDTVYDTFGRVSKVSRNHLSGYAPAWTVFAYDALGRVTTVTGPDNAVTTTTYSGLTTAVTLPASDGKIRSKTEKKTSTGLLDTVTDAVNGKIVYKYDALGNLAKVTTTGADGKTFTITSTFDIRGRKTAMTDPDMGSWTYTYNAFGQLISQKDAKAQAVTMAYDALGRMTTRTELEGTSTWTYDTAAFGKGKLAKVTGPTNQYQRTYLYDSLGRISVVGTSINGELFNVSTSYNANTGRVESTTYPAAGGSSLVVYNNYKYGGYLESVSSGPNATGTIYWRQTAGDANGNVTAESLGNGVTTTRTFDPVRGLLTDIDSTGPQGLVQDLHYDYFSGVPNMSRRVDNQRAYTENFTYDALNRVLGVTGSRTVTYAYDSLGNITKKSDYGSAYTYGQKATDNFAGPHAVTTIKNGTTTVATYKYDKNGNQFSGAGRTTTYTSYNLPKTVTSAAETMSFAYDPERNRIVHVSNGNTMIYLSPRWDTGTHYTRETKTNGTVEHKHYIYGNGPVAQYTVTVSGSTVTKATHYLHYDHLGSVQTITDSTGKIVTVYRYDPFGKQQLVTGSNTITHHGFTGHEMHNGAGFIHMNGRTYDPSNGRFMQSDPNIDGVTNLQGFNRYSYVSNNPLSFTDPSGYFLSGLKKALKKTVNRWQKGLDKNWSKYRRAIVTVVVIAAVAYTGGAAYKAYAAYGAASAGAAAGMATGALTGAIAG
jgi:RHS repeat-associated protein